MSGSDRSPADAAFLKALEILGRRDHSRAELRQKLAARGYADEPLNEALDRLARHGFIDDARFAARWVEAALRNGRGYGMKLLTGLRGKGIDRETAEQALAAAAVATPEPEALAAVVCRRFAGYDDKSASPRERQRVYAYLQRRGFTIAAIIGHFRNHDTE